MTNFCFPKKVRLLKRGQFLKLSKQGKRVYTDCFIAIVFTGTISYRVVDTVIDADPLLDGTLYNVVLSFDLGGVGVTALYIDPDAS